MEQEKPKVLWVSDLVLPTGFSRVSHSIIEHIENKYDITGIGVNYRGDPHNFKFPIYPAISGGRIFGEDRVIQILNNVKMDILFILNDAWLINQYLIFLKKNVAKEKMPKIVVYFPVDSKEHDPDWYENYDIVSQAVTYTEFGRTVVREANENLEVDVIPHGVNQDVFYRKYVNRRDAKKQLLNGARDPDSFILLNANRNQPRKRLDITLKAFKLFAENKPDALLHMHCGVRDSHIDVARFARRLGMDNKLILSNLNPGVQLVSDAMLNDIYNAADVGLNSSMGEGWGLTNIEHAITGAPQIVGDHSSCAEIFSDCGLLVPTALDYTFDNSMTEGKLISPEKMAEKMEILYTNKELYKELSRKSVEKFSDPKYSWKFISTQWDSIFKRVLDNHDNNLALEHTSGN